MGRRKIEIKAIKDDRNRSVTFLKRKGGLFKKAHELSVLCSVDVAVFIFGSNKKLYEYSSGDMRELITRYTYHGGPNEHKGPADFNGGEDDDEEDGEATPPHGHEGSVEPGMIPPHFQAQHQPPFPHLRGHTASASPPINGVAFPRGHTPQPQMGSRPSSRTDFRRAPVGPQGAPPQPNGYAYMPHPMVYNSQSQAPMPPTMQHGLPPQPPPPTQYSYQHPQHPQPQHAPQHVQMQQQQQQHYMEEQRRASVTPSYPSHAPPPPTQSVQRPQPSPPPPHPQQLPQPVPQMSPPQPHHHLEVPQPQHMTHHAQPEPQPQSHPQPPSQQQQQPPPPPPAPLGPRADSAPDRPSQRLLDTSAAVKKLPPRKGHSIFTPIDENRSILSQHLESFVPEPRNIKELSREDATRSHSVDVGAVQRDNETSSPPPPPQRSHTSNLAGSSSASQGRNSVSSSVPETTFTPPSRSNSLRVGGAPRPKLKVQIPDEASEAGSNTQESTTSPRNPQDTASQAGNRRNGVETHGAGPVLPPPSPSASALLSAGATGPPNPFARPIITAPNNNSSMNIDTPVSALPSRFLNQEFLPSPSSFYPDWNFRGNDNNTLPSPLNFATPVVGTGPSFLREDNPHKRKSPEISTAGPSSDGPEGTDAKRVRVDS